MLNEQKQLYVGSPFRCSSEANARVSSLTGPSGRTKPRRLLVLAQWGISVWSAPSRAVQRAFGNSPVVLVKNGVLREDAMGYARVARAALEQQMRNAA